MFFINLIYINRNFIVNLQKYTKIYKNYKNLQNLHKTPQNFTHFYINLQKFTNF